MSIRTSTNRAAAGLLGAAALALIPSAVAAADTPAPLYSTPVGYQTGLLPSQVNPVDSAIANIQKIPVVTQTLLTYGNLAGDGGGLVWGTLDLIYRIQIPRSPTDSTPIQLTPDYYKLVNSSASASSGAAVVGVGRLEVVGTRVARDGRSVRVKVACVGGTAGCDGTIRIRRPPRKRYRKVVMTKNVHLASGETRKFTLR